jgi:hypothetical protein
MMFLTVRGDPHSLHRREGRNLQPRQHPTTAIVAALLLCHGDGEANADMNFAVEMDENERSRRAWRTAASTRRSMDLAAGAAWAAALLGARSSSGIWRLRGACLDGRGRV